MKQIRDPGHEQHYQVLMGQSELAARNVPTLLACLSCAYTSRRPRLSFFVAVLGACIGAFLAPGLSANLEQILHWLNGIRWHGLQQIGIIDVAIPPLAAILVGGVGGYFMQAAAQTSDD